VGSGLRRESSDESVTWDLISSLMDQAKDWRHRSGLDQRFNRKNCMPFVTGTVTEYHPPLVVIGRVRSVQPAP
jgi:hypothetical protein